MGSCADMADTNRAIAVLEKAPLDLNDHPVPELRQYLGQRVMVTEVRLVEQLASICAEAMLITESGDEVWITLGTILDIADSGVCGYALEEHFEADVLRPMVRAAIADQGNGLSSEDRKALREDLEYYLSD